MSNIAVHNWPTHDEVNDLNGVFQVATPLDEHITVEDVQLNLDASANGQFFILVDAAIDASAIINGMPGQVVIVAFEQGATGGTVSWPTAKYAAGAAPTTSATAGFTDVVTYVFDGVDWEETARSIGNH